jgi:hypothetical protein
MGGLGLAGEWVISGRLGSLREWAFDRKSVPPRHASIPYHAPHYGFYRVISSFCQ